MIVEGSVDEEESKEENDGRLAIEDLLDLKDLKIEIANDRVKNLIR